MGVVYKAKKDMQKSFVEKLDPEALTFFNEVLSRPFSRQAVAFLNAYWAEVKSEAEFIYTVAWDTIKYADMHAKGVTLVFKYDEGTELDFDIALYFYERLCKFLGEESNEEWVKKYPRSQPEMMTSIKRKQELREKVDVNFDGRMSFLEYLLFQYKDVANPADFCTRSMNKDEHPEIRKARIALEEVNKDIQAFEAEKERLTEASKGKGVKALGAKNMLAQLGASPLADKLRASLIKAEAALRRAVKLFSGITGEDGADESSAGALWWMQRELEEKKKRYGGRK